MEKQQIPVQQAPQAWDPKAQPAGAPLGAYAPQPGAPGYPVAAGQQPGYAAQPGMVVVQAGPYPTATFCPVTGGAHDPDERMGLIGIIIGIVFCPCGIIACFMDKKITCRNCKFVIKESWGGA
ncbi:uncharacterized protein LOC62_05G007051 [Vanrija pseudolonga]|uniref:Brain protein I3 n=1 Tax=Vanrija pseudolonga TaxID=143232 RepID=A0AAF1BML4_9TREE|nr:hypothetical protein LOC62_05G007051 [Vanrija pseudolonga]